MADNEVITRREFDGFSSRVSHSIESINKSVNRMEVVVESMGKTIDKMSNVMFGDKNTGEGMVVKMARLSTVQKVQVWLVSTIIVGLIGFSFYLMQKNAPVSSQVVTQNTKGSIL